MSKVITWDLGDNFIDNLSGFILEEFKRPDFDTSTSLSINPKRSRRVDFSNLACVFGGRRPGLFLRKSLSEKIKKPFYPPKVFTIDEFVEYIVAEPKLKLISDLEAAYSIYKIAAEIAPGLLNKRETFSEFLPWAREISSFIEQLDLEDISDSSLKDIEKSAKIGYEIPESINALLERIVAIRRAYQENLSKKDLYTRGRLYRQASQKIKDKDFKEFESIIFCNFFYLQKTESRIMKEIKAKGKGLYLFQGSGQDWSVLEKNFREFDSRFEPPVNKAASPELKFYQAFDKQSEAALVGEIFKKIENKQDTVIVLPQADNLIAVLSEISPAVDECNISMGYPLARSSLYALFVVLRRAQESRRGQKVYTRDYLNLIRHPMVKNLKIIQDPAATRVIVHKLEELISASQPSTISGSLFLELSQIESEDKIYSLATETLESMGIDFSQSQCRKLLRKLHQLLFLNWQEADSFSKFSKSLTEFLLFLIENSSLDKFPFNLKVIEKLMTLAEELGNLTFSDEPFSLSQIWDIFEQKLSYEKIAFSGSPLKGTQILGLFETRSLSFENVIITGMNEGVLPKLKIYEPLVPREVMLNLGLNRLEKEEEIHRYQFNSLVASSRRAYLIYEKNPAKERSRFIEEIFWKIQREKSQYLTPEIPLSSFSLIASLRKYQIPKTPQVIESLKAQVYSASRINTYLQCPLKFYYQYVLGLKAKDDLLDEPQSWHIGNFIHEILEETFSDFKGRKPSIDDKFVKHFFARMDKKFDQQLAARMRSDSFLLKRIIRKRLESFLDQEKERPVKRLVGLEEKRSSSLDFSGYSLNFNYTLDRIDELEDSSLLIIDYKTGGSDIMPKSFNSLKNMPLERESIKENIKSFQLPLYYHFISREFPEKSLNAELYNLRTLEHNQFISDLDYSQREKLIKICLESLEVIIDELFDSGIPFSPEREERKCQNCPFKGFCF